MTAYAVFIQERTRNAAELQKYTEMLRPLLSGSGGTVLAAHGPQDILEGAAPEGVVLVSFPSMETARAFYNSPEYQAAVKHRFLGADYRSFIIGGIN